MKYIYVVFFVCVFSQMNAQNDTQNQVEQNEKKAEELRAKLNGISNSDGAEDLTTKLDKMEEMMNKLLQEVQSLKQEKNCCCDLNLKIQEQLSLISDNMEKKSSTRSVVNKKGDFYVIVESQRSIVLAKKAQQVNRIRSNRELIILKNKESEWYYLAVPQKQSYLNAVDMINKNRIKGFEDAWWISVDEVELEN